MKSGPWALTLNQTSEEPLEERVTSVVNYLSRAYEDCQWQVSDLDATGKFGGELTLRLNDGDRPYLKSADLLAVLTEDGQVIDLEVAILVNRQPLFKIIIQDGSSVDILGKGMLLPIDVLGDYRTSDPKIFLWN